MIELIILFVIKHFVVDFLLQIPFMYKNKGEYGHLGGILHAGFHGISTMLILAAYYINTPSVGIWFIYILGTFDAFTHYHIDWAKVNICKKFNWTPTNSDKYWHMVGLDQTLHYLVYVVIIERGMSKV